MRQVNRFRAFPNIKWAQRKDKVMLTIDQPDCENIKIELSEEGLLSFS